MDVTKKVFFFTGLALLIVCIRLGTIISPAAPIREAPLSRPKQAPLYVLPSSVSTSTISETSFPASNPKTLALQSSPSISSLEASNHQTAAQTLSAFESAFFLRTSEEQNMSSSRISDERGAKSFLEETLRFAQNEPLPIRDIAQTTVRAAHIPALPLAGVVATTPRIHANAVLLVNLQTGESMFALNEQKQWPLASLTKLMTAVIAIEKLDSNQVVEIGKDDIISPAGTRRYLNKGERFSVHDLLVAMLTVSSNEAAEALASAQNRTQFIQAMNKKAKELGMADTFFEEPTGLSVSNQSTPRDLMALAHYVYGKLPQILMITRAPEARITEQKSGGVHTLSNINVFAGRDDFLGGKTGYTDDANGNLISFFRYKDNAFVSVVLGTSDRFGETEKLFEWLKRSFRTNP